MSVAITTARPTSHSSLRRLLADHPLISYFALAFAAVWIPLLPVVLASNGVGLLPFTVSDVAFVLLFIGGTLLGPTASALIVTAAADGRAGVRALLRRYIQCRDGAQWYLLAIFGPLALHVLAASLFGGAAPLRDVATNWAQLVTSYPMLLLAMILFPALIEEPGWRGFALPRLLAARGPLMGTLILGILHAVWHLPVYFLVSGPAAIGPFDITHFVTNSINIVAITFFWSWVANNARGSILVAILLHAANNATGQLLPSFMPHYPPSFDWIMFGANIAVALLIVVATKGQLGYRPSPAPAAAPAPQPQGDL
jgi:membrane protease YdiL (CAAX protease family)